MLFSYWEGPRAVADAFLATWRPLDPDTWVFTQADVELFLSELHPGWLEVFQTIRIPACRSDVARLVILERVGGFYLDIHSGPGDPAALGRLRSLLLTYEFVLFRATDHLERRQLYIPNGALLGRRGSLVTLYLVESAFGVLARHRQDEARTQGHLAYNIAALTGGWLYGLKLLDMANVPFDPTPAFRDLVRVEDVHSVDPHAAFTWYANYDYRGDGEHWSERQKTEPLFKAG